ncbi:MAG: Rne/Rng family ribonuclease [Gemmatimonadetes bacterium]|nr:Rne/Rng family ribonuclease [Gemmatimonadota bacterium]
MRREILVSATVHESWVALMEDEQLVEMMLDRADQGRLLGDIYLGKVEAVLPGIQAAFVDIGTDKAGFLHVSDLEMGDDDDENGGGGRQRRDRKYPPIQDHIRKGQEIIVQVTKEPIGTKGPRLTAEISLPGRFLVYMPGSSRVGVSRKIEDREERSRLRKLAKEVLPKDEGGIIVRTVSEELNQETFKKDFKRLSSKWRKILKKREGVKAPSPLHGEAKLISGVIRDLFSNRFESITVDDKGIYREILQYVKSVAPELKDRVRLYTGSESLFDKYGVEEEFQATLQKKAMLPSGGYIIIEPTEALVSIDVNTGRYKGKKDPESTILKTNLEATQEIARQLRLRDIGGIIVCDFIDMDSQKNRDKVLNELRTHLGRDRARTKAFEVSSLGLVEMTRQRVRPSLFQTLTEECDHCEGTGRVYSPATVVRQIERSIRRVSLKGAEKKLLIRMHPEVALRILEKEPDFIRKLGQVTSLKLDMSDDPLLREDEFRILSGATPRGSFDFAACRYSRKRQREPVRTRRRDRTDRRASWYFPRTRNPLIQGIDAYQFSRHQWSSVRESCPNSRKAGNILNHETTYPILGGVSGFMGRECMGLRIRY